MFESPRHDLALEKQAILAILNNADGITVLRELVAEDFYDQWHRDIFTAMLDIAAKGDSVNFMSVSAALNGIKWFDAAGGSTFLASFLLGALPYIPSFSIAPALRKMTILRMQEELKLQYGDVTENLQALEAARDTYLGLLPSQTKRVQDFKHLLGKGKRAGQLSGFYGIDNLTNGMTPGQFIVIGARTGVGKSIYLMNVAAYVAQKEKKVLWIALEMSEEEVLERFVKMLSEEGHPDALDYLVDMHIISGSKTASQIESEAMRGEYDVIVLDYLQLVRPERRYDSEVQRLEDLTRRMKQLAMASGTILLAAAQLNRESEQHARAPRISDLRGSGSIEQDADVVILIHRLKRTSEKGSGKKSLDADHVARELEGKGDTTVYLEKNRAGAEGQIEMTFDAHRLRFVDPSIMPAWGDLKLF